MRPEALEESRRLAHRYFLDAYRAQMHGKLRKAVRLYRRSAEVYPTAEAHSFMGWTMSLLGRYEDAISCCKRAIELDPDSGDPRNDIGAYLIELDRPTEAIAWLAGALRARHCDSRHFAHYNLGRAYEKLLDPLQAEACYRRSLSDKPSYELAGLALKRLAARRN